MGGKDTRKSRANNLWLAAVLVGMMPLFMAAAPLTFSPWPTGWQIFIRSQALIVPAIEACIILLLLRAGGSIRTGWQGLPRMTQWALALFLPIMLIVTFQPGNDYILASLGLLRLLMLGLVALALASLPHQQVTDFQAKAWSMIGVGVVGYSVVYLCYILANQLVDRQWSEHLPGFNNIRHVAFLGFAAFAAGIAGCLTIDDRGANWRRLLLPVAFGALGMMLPLWSGSRGPVLACILLVGILLLIQKQERGFISVYTIATIGTAFVATSIIPAPITAFGPAEAFGAADLNGPGAADISSGRVELWRGTIEHIAQRPWLGWGVNQFSQFEPISGEVFFHPHNYPLQLLHACGILGSAAIAIAIVPIFARHRAFFATRNGRFHAALLCALGGYALYDGILYFAYPLLISMLAALPFFQAPGQHVARGTHQ